MKQLLAALAVAILGAMFGLAMSFVVPPRYPVSTVVEIGRVPEITGEGLERSSPIDMPAAVASALRQPGTLREVARAIAATENGVPPGGLDELARRTRTRVLAPADLVEVSVWSTDPELAAHWLEQLTQPVIDRHGVLFEATVQRYRSELHDAMQRLREIDSEVRTLTDQRADGAHGNGLTDLAYGQTLSLLDLSRRYWDERATTLQASLDPRILRRTHRVGPTSIDLERGLPKRSLLVSLGALLAFLGWGAWRIARTHG